MEGSEFLWNERITQAPSGEEKAAIGSSGRDNAAGLIEKLSFARLPKRKD
jgi:hypothetical protein